MQDSRAESNSGKECIKVALPQYILDRIRAEEEENKRLEAEKDEDKRLEAESKESVVEGPGEGEPAQPGVAGPAAGGTEPRTNPGGPLVDLPIALHGQHPNIAPVSAADTATPRQQPTADP